MFVNDVHKQAVKAATAILVIQDDASPDLAALGICEAVNSLALQAGDMAGNSALHRYAKGVADNEEKVSNRKWGNYPTEVGRLARKVAAQARAEIDAIFC